MSPTTSFGTGTTETRHFTTYGLKHDTTGNTGTRLDGDLPAKLRLMNPMPFLTGGKPTPTAPSTGGSASAPRTPTPRTRVSANLAAAAAALGDDVNHLYYWDEGHGANSDPGDFIEWIAKVTGYKPRK
jgi:hypothetical protein